MSLKTVTIADIAAPDKRSIAIGPFGSSLKADLYVPSGVPVVRGQNIKDGGEIDESDLVFVEPDVADRFPACLINEGDLVFPHRGAIGRVGIVGKRSMLLSSSMMKLTVDRLKADSRFVLYYFRGPGRNELLMRTSTVGTPGIGQPLTSLRGIPIQMPELSQQRAIAEVLGALDDKIAANTKVASTASMLAACTYDYSTVGLPMRAMSEVLSPILGGTPTRARPNFWGGRDLWASAKDVTGAEFGVVTDTAEKITGSAVADTKAKPLPTGSVILTARGTVGAVARLARPASFNQSCYGFVPGRIPSGVLFFAVLRATEKAKEIAHGSVFDTITMKSFDHLAFPAFDAQELMTTELKIAPLLDLVTKLVVENQKIVGLRDTLLPQLMSGTLRVKDAEAAVSAAV